MNKIKQIILYRLKTFLLTQTAYCAILWNEQGEGEGGSPVTTMMCPHAPRYFGIWRLDDSAKKAH